eukprot:566282-Rhodomonas_salina.1
MCIRDRCLCVCVCVSVSVSRSLALLLLSLRSLLTHAPPPSAQVAAALKRYGGGRPSVLQAGRRACGLVVTVALQARLHFHFISAATSRFVSSHSCSAREVRLLFFLLLAALCRLYMRILRSRVAGRVAADTSGLC